MCICSLIRAAHFKSADSSDEEHFMDAVTMIILINEELQQMVLGSVIDKYTDNTGTAGSDLIPPAPGGVLNLENDDAAKMFISCYLDKRLFSEIKSMT